MSPFFIFGWKKMLIELGAFGYLIQTLNLDYFRTDHSPKRLGISVL